MRLGSRTEGTGVSIDLKETRRDSYRISLQTMLDGKRRSNKQGYEFGLHVEFNNEEGDLIEGFAVIPWKVYEELRQAYQSED